MSDDLHFIAPTGARIIGTLETIPGVCRIGDVEGIDENGTALFHYDGNGTEVNWDGQKTVTRQPHPAARKQRVFVDETGAEWLEAELRTSDEAAPVPDLVLICELAERFLSEGEPLSTSDRAAAAAALGRIKATRPEFEEHAYRRSNLEVGGFRWPSVAEVPAGPLSPIRTSDDDAELFGVFTKDDRALVEEFDDRAAAEEYLEAIAHG